MPYGKRIRDHFENARDGEQLSLLGRPFLGKPAALRPFK